MLLSNVHINNKINVKRKKNHCKRVMLILFSRITK